MRNNNKIIAKQLTEANADPTSVRETISSVTVSYYEQERDHHATEYPGCRQMPAENGGWMILQVAE